MVHFEGGPEFVQPRNTLTAKEKEERDRETMRGIQEQAREIRKSLAEAVVRKTPELDKSKKWVLNKDVNILSKYSYGIKGVAFEGEELRLRSVKVYKVKGEDYVKVTVNHSFKENPRAKEKMISISGYVKLDDIRQTEEKAPKIAPRRVKKTEEKVEKRVEEKVEGKVDLIEKVEIPKQIIEKGVKMNLVPGLKINPKTLKVQLDEDSGKKSE